MAQKTPPVPPRVLRTADLIGARAELLELTQLRSQPGFDRLREIGLIQRLQGMVIASQLDVDSVNARIDYEMARLQDVQNLLSAQHERGMRLLNMASVLGGGLGALGTGMQLGNSTQTAGNIMGASAGTAATVLSMIALKKKGQVRPPGYTPAMLAEILGTPPTKESNYPAEIWRYLNTPDPSLPRDESPIQHLVVEWRTFHLLSNKPEPERIAKLTSTGKKGMPLSISTIGDRTGMLADVRANVGTMLVDLASLMRFVVAEE
jgi:hypothetical protein